ncbi:hypothetical protein [Maribacter halichondriae]|uniref:hypothetical protein n=1 Tax=Maribacter halichondriae TaxID=2980554 RepID=UPI002359F5AC|nr:hypothetical protein [Maribacter sp. Hal144]
MIKDLIVSFSDNFKEKTRNPFLGTYVLIWILRNWELVYSLFNFDNSYKLENKVAFIKKYYETNSFSEGVFWNLGWTFLVLTITYVVLNISRVIINISEKQLKPWVYKKTDSKSIVLKSDHEQVRSTRDSLQLRLDRERDSKSKLESIIKDLEEQITEITRTQLEREVEENTAIDNSKPLNIVEIIYNKLFEENLLDEFSNFATTSKKDGYIDDNYKHTDRFIQLGLVKFLKEHWNNNSKQYTITQDGEGVLKYMRLQ